MTKVTGMVLDRELSAYLTECGMTRKAFAAAAGVKLGRIAQLLRRGVVDAELVETVRGYIAAHPAKVAQAEPASVVEAVARELAENAERRELAQRQGCLKPQPMPRTMVETIAGAVVDTPGDLIAMVRRRWPQLWDGVVVQARAEQVTPGAMLFTVIERGLGLETVDG